MKSVIICIKKKLIVLLLFGFCFKSTSTNGQVINYLKSIEFSDDSLLAFKKFKSIDTVLTTRLDSFYKRIEYFKKITKEDSIYYNVDPGYIVADFNEGVNKKLRVDLSLNNTYVDYLISVDKSDNYQGLFGYAYYRGKLVIFISRYKKFKISDKYIPFFRKSLKKTVSKEVKKLMKEQSNDIGANHIGHISKRYYL